MLTTIAKRIQSRLSRAGVKVSLSDIKTQCELIIIDTDNPTEDQLIDVQNYFMNNATTLTVIPTNESEVIEAQLPTSSEILEVIEEQKSSLATTTKSELISQAANSLNIELSTTEIEAIATNFTASSDDFTATLDELKLAILAFIDHKVQCNNLMITNTINEIYSVASEGFESNNQHLNDGLSQLNKALNQQSADFKSRLKNTLAKFQIPAA
jgi:uncharacterized protein YukE